MAEFEKRLACVIAADGSIARGYMIESCELVGANEYVITWKVPLQKEAKTNFSCVIGSVAFEDVEPGDRDQPADEPTAAFNADLAITAPREFIGKSEEIA